MLKKYLISLAATLLVSLPVCSATLFIDSSNQLYGATGIEVSGSFYDVLFINGSCSQLYNGCDQASDFIFSSQNAAVSASQALFDQVLIDDSFNTAQWFNSDPEKTTGCSNSGLCRLLTPFGLTETTNIIAGVTADNNAVNANDILEPNIGIDKNTDLADATIATYAVWNAQVATVPIPASALLFSSCLIFLFVLPKKTLGFSAKKNVGY